MSRWVSPFRFSDMSPDEQDRALRVARDRGRDAYGARPYIENPYQEPNQRAAWEEGKSLARLAAQMMETT